MGAKTFTELIAWQAANRFKIEVYRLTARTGVEKDFDFCNQIRRSSSSVSSNLAEGFARYGHRDFARFVAIARASLIETQNHLIDATDRGHIQEGEFKAL